MNARIEATTDAAYHADKSHLTRGMLMDFRDSPRLFHAWHVAQTAEKPGPKNPRVGIGEACHKALLQPHLFGQVVRKIPADVLSKSGSRAGNAWKEFAEENAACVLLKDEEFAAAEAMARAVDESFGWLLCKATRIEHAIYWTDDTTGLRLKCKPDALIFHAQSAVCIDLKSTADVAPQAFAQRVAGNGYWMQAAHYSEGVRELLGPDAEIDFLFLAVDGLGNPPACYRLDGETIARASDEWRKTINAIAGCFERDEWRCSWERVITDLAVKSFAFSTTEVLA